MTKAYAGGYYGYHYSVKTLDWALKNNDKIKLEEKVLLVFAKILKYNQFVWCAAVSIAVEMLFLPIKNLKRNQTGATVWEICVFRK